ncbi:MAG TPA: OmpA family protein [Flavobacteriales bacterium]|nr:OmpA family protein [Flavobacteriales bacterium]
MKKLIYTTAFVLAAGFSFAQSVEFKEANFKDKKEELKKAKEAIKKGDEYLKDGNDLILETKSPGKNFDLAIQQYLIAQNLNPNNADVNFKLGNAYIFTNEKYKAIKHIERANELDPECDPKIKFFTAMTLHLKGEYDKAVQVFQSFETSRKAEAWNKFIDKYKKECLEAKKITAKSERVWVDNIESIIGPADDFNSCIVTDGSQIIFTSNRSNGHPANDVGKYDFDIYVSNNVNNEWQKPTQLGPPLNSTNDESTSNLSYDGNKLLIYKNDPGNFDIFESKLMGANWEAAKPMHKQFNSPANQTFAAYEPNDMKIYFLTDKEGVAENGTDFYTCGAYDRSHATYGAPVKESGISTRFNEGSIYLHPDNETMYFTSQGHNSIGGYDIFVSYKKQGQWGEPINLGYPINTPYDETFVAMTASGKYAYIASNRDGGKGGLDIYKVTFWGPEKKLVTDTEDYLLAGIAKPIVDNTIEASVAVDRKSLTVFKGVTIDAISRKPVTANIDIIDNSNGSVIQTITTNSATGKFLISLNSGKNYGIAVKADGYLFHSENFDIPQTSEYNLVDKTIELKNIAVGSKIALRNIFFAFGLATLDPKSNTELDRLVKLMKDVPALKVEISGHTDNIGSESSNQKLSDDRATSVVNYLVGKGIAKDRLTPKGYGSSRPVATNNSDEGRQQNRRTEFEITGNK